MAYTTSDLIAVTAYGAKGDGSTDDTAAIGSDGLAVANTTTPTLDLAAGPVLSG
jgi:polygalacturonase